MGKQWCGRRWPQAAFSTVLTFHPVAIHIEPSPTLANEATALMLANGGSIADTRTGDELHFGRITACNTRIDDPKSQPLLIPVEWDRTGSGTRMPRREQILLVTQNEGAVAGSHQRLRVKWGIAGVQRTTALGIRAGGTARAGILGRGIHWIKAITGPHQPIPSRLHAIRRTALIPAK